MPPRDPEPAPTAAEPVDDEQLWSWVDRDAPELDSHLAAHPEDRARVDSLRRAIRAVAGEEVIDRTPESIGGYTIVRRLGSGGMGVVFEAEQARPRRRVALKVIRGAWLDDAPTRRLFFREAEVLARLNHPGIAQIFEAGETKEGAPFFVMELSNGLALDKWARGEGRSSPPSFERRMEVFERICRAVHHAHEKGVVHRDLKPSNVLVEEGDRPKVLDFGLARIIDPDTNVSLTAAVTGRVVGTVRYMSPEQARGLASRATATSDVYSLGVLLYELLTGRLPHDFEGTSIFEAARKVASDPIPAPSTVLTAAHPRFPAAFDAITMQALAKEPGGRYASAFALADDVRRALEGAPVSASPPKPRAALADLGADIGRAFASAGEAVQVAVRSARAAASDPETREHVRRAAEEARRASHEAAAHARRVSLAAGAHARRASHAAATGAREVADKAQRSMALFGQKLRERSTLAHERYHAGGSRARAWLRVQALRAQKLVALGLVVAGLIAWVNRDEWLPASGLQLDHTLEFAGRDTRRHVGVPLFHEHGALGLSPRVAPWDGVRWQGERPSVRVLGAWAQLESVEGVSTEALIAAIRAVAPAEPAEAWQREFEERLAEHLRPLLQDDAPDRAFDLVVRLGESSPSVRIEDVPATASNVQALVRRRLREQQR